MAQAVLGMGTVLSLVGCFSLYWAEEQGAVGAACSQVVAPSALSPTSQLDLLGLSRESVLRAWQGSELGRAGWVWITSLLRLLDPF